MTKKPPSQSPGPPRLYERLIGLHPLKYLAVTADGQSNVGHIYGAERLHPPVLVEHHVQTLVGQNRDEVNLRLLAVVGVDNWVVL